MKRFFLIACLLALSGCVQSPEQIAAARQRQQQADANACASYGFRPRTDAFSNCMMQIDIARQQAYYYYETAPPPYVYYGYGYGWRHFH